MTATILLQIWNHARIWKGGVGAVYFLASGLFTKDKIPLLLSLGRISQWGGVFLSLQWGHRAHLLPIFFDKHFWWWKTPLLSMGWIQLVWSLNLAWSPSLQRPQVTHRICPWKSCNLHHIIFGGQKGPLPPLSWTEKLTGVNHWVWGRLILARTLFVQVAITCLHCSSPSRALTYCPAWYVVILLPDFIPFTTWASIW